MSEVNMGSIKKIYCNTCRSDTNHEVIATHQRHYDEIEGEHTLYPQRVFWEEWRYRVWVCRGCDTTALEEAYTCDGMHHPDKDEYVYDSTYYPQRERFALRKRHFRHLDSKLQAVYTEVIATFNADAKIACAMCLRALLEGVCINKGITDKVAWGLEKKLRKIEEGNHLPHNIVASLLSFKFIGDDAAHKLLSATRKELEASIEVMGDLLNFLYEVEYELVSKAQKLSSLRDSQMKSQPGS